MEQLTESTYSWWRESRNSQRQSLWLHNALAEMDQKIQNMLSLVEAEADSFSQRAEIFYYKRPQLISMIEEYYRAYRSLAEQYDHLKGEIRQNVSESVQVSNGLSCESPLKSPFRNQISVNKNLNQGFKEFLRSQERYGFDEEVSEVEDTDSCKWRSKRSSDQEAIKLMPSDEESASTLSYSDSEVASHVVELTETENVGSMVREMYVKMEEENSLLLKQLIAKNIQVEHLKIENNKLKEEKAFCKEKISLVMQDKSLLLKELENIKVEKTKLENENEVNVWEKNDLHKELYFIREEKTKLQNENEVNAQQLQVLTKKVSNMQKENNSYKVMLLALACVNERLRNEMCGVNQQNEGAVRSLKNEKKKVEDILEATENLVLEQSFKIKELQSEACYKNVELDIIKAESTKLRNENEVNAQKMEELWNEYLLNAQRMQELRNENEVNAQKMEERKMQIVREMGRGNRHDKGEANVQVQILSEKIRSLGKENTNLSKQNKIMPLVYVNSQAARLDTSNTRPHNEICGDNSQGMATVQILKDDKKNVEITVDSTQKSTPEQNFRTGQLQSGVRGLVAENTIAQDEIEVDVQSLQGLKENVCYLQEGNTKLCTQSKVDEIILEAKERLVMEQSLRTGEMQNEVYQLHENRVEEIQLLKRNKQKRVVINTLMYNNKRMQKALQKLREKWGSNPDNSGISTSKISRWKKFLFARGGCGASAI